MRTTITEALATMRGLHTADAGILRGINLRYRYGLPQPSLAGTPQPWRDRLHQAITHHDAAYTPSAPHYLVFSGNLVIAVLTAAGQVQLPDYPLTRLQARHQAAAAQALGDLHRHTLAGLADTRATAEGRHHDTDDAGHPHGALRVAPATDPTRTTWVAITADTDAVHRSMADACGASPGQTLIVTAPGYGRYGTRRHRLDLDILITMHQIAGIHHVRLPVIGDWLDAEGYTGHDLDPGTLLHDFAAAYAGPYPSELAYSCHRMDHLGWTQTLQHAGIPDRYLDRAAINRDWFHDHVRAIPNTTTGIEVFRRRR